MDAPFGRKRFTIRLAVVAAFTLATILIAALGAGLQFYFSQSMAKEAATSLYATISSGVAAELRSVRRVNANVIDLLAEIPAFSDRSKREAHRNTFIDVMRKNPLYYGLYLGAADNSFYEVINLNSSEEVRQLLKAQASDRWLEISIEKTAQGPMRHYRYLNEHQESRLTRSEPTDFQVASRPWYELAIASDDAQQSPPYRFAQMNIPGRTISKRIGESNTVVAIDMTLSTISRFLGDNRASEHGIVYLFGKNGDIVASSVDQSTLGMAPDVVAPSSENNGSNATPVTTLTQIAADSALHGKLTEVKFNDEIFLAYVAPVDNDENPLFMGILSSRDKVLAPYLDRVKWSILLTLAFLLLLLPFSWLFANPIVRPVKQLALENDKVRRRDYDQVNRVSSSIKELDDLSDSMVSMVSAIRAHEIAQRELMDSFIELIASAIDQKSAYTGAHCARVPELALMLARQASESEHPAFEGFSLHSDDEWREYRIAAWLHDCGKITTPDHIVDKGSKLETIYNRIHEVRMRFEVLWRDAEIHYLQQLQSDPDKEIQYADELNATRSRLQEDFAFVAECNVGGEFLDEKSQGRLHTIAETTWQRNFSDQLGLSPLEELRAVQDKTLPATEPLLSDKPEHIVSREQSTNYPPELGINMEVPEYLYNLGEIYNLSISRGTLTAEDRFKINEHMISTIKMLESLPFPEELQNVPRYASTHHETMKGSGYPRKLDGEDLSIPERLLAIADIFEALTASDRPYKKAKPVSEAIDIMYKMVLDEHIDRDCFELFLRDEVYLRYAKEYLPEIQIDPVNTAEYLS